MLAGHLPELFIVLTLALVVFGPKRLPEIGSSLGKGEPHKGSKESWKNLTGKFATDTLALDETHVYASIEPTKDARLKAWLSNSLDRQPSFRVTILERRPRAFGD